MSSEARNYVEEFLAVSPWIAFVLAVVWFWVLEVRDNLRTSRASQRESSRRLVRTGRADADDDAK